MIFDEEKAIGNIQAAFGKAKLLAKRLVHHMTVLPPFPVASAAILGPKALDLAATASLVFAPEAYAPLKAGAKFLSLFPQDEINKAHDRFVTYVADRINLPQEYRIDMDKHRENVGQALNIGNRIAAAFPSPAPA